MGTERQWTEADQAELDVVTQCLFREVAAHRIRCEACKSAGTTVFCRAVDAAIFAVWEWAWFRRLLSRAEYLRKAA